MLHVVLGMNPGLHLHEASTLLIQLNSQPNFTCNGIKLKVEQELGKLWNTLLVGIKTFRNYHYKCRFMEVNTAPLEQAAYMCKDSKNT